MKINKHVIFLTVVALLVLFSAYLFYYADCSVVKQYWYLAHAPGRCL
jgi:hypothetical protein